MTHTPLKEADTASFQQKNPFRSTNCCLPQENTILWETNNLIIPDIWVGTIPSFLYNSSLQLGNVSGKLPKQIREK